MDFKLSEEQLLIQESAREIAGDFAQRPAADALNDLADADFLGLFYPEQLGGADGDFLSYIVALQEIAKVSASLALAYAVQATQVCHALASFANDELKANYLPDLFSGEKRAAYAFGEITQGKDGSEINAHATKDKENYVINGQKTFVYGADTADSFVVFAQTDSGLSAFMVDRQIEGVAVSEPYEKMGLDGLSMSTVTLSDVHIPGGHLIGQEGTAEQIAKSVFDLHSTSLAAIACGVLQTAIKKTIDYGKARIQFHCPILSFESMSEKIGQMIIAADAAQLVTYKAAVAWDETDPDYSRNAYHARVFSIQSGERICTNAIQMHGGYGYSKDLGVEVLLRDMKGLSVFEELAKPVILLAASADIA
ncbi:MAG: acyl-CoA dehydrogenase family protein [Sporolactobacillus sp.]